MPLEEELLLSGHLTEALLSLSPNFPTLLQKERGKPLEEARLAVLLAFHAVISHYTQAYHKSSDAEVAVPPEHLDKHVLHLARLLGKTHSSNLEMLVNVVLGMSHAVLGIHHQAASHFGQCEGWRWLPSLDNPVQDLLAIWAMYLRGTIEHAAEGGMLVRLAKWAMHARTAPIVGSEAAFVPIADTFLRLASLNDSDAARHWRSFLTFHPSRHNPHRIFAAFDRFLSCIEHGSLSCRALYRHTLADQQARMLDDPQRFSPESPDEEVLLATLVQMTFSDEVSDAAVQRIARLNCPSLLLSVRTSYILRIASAVCAGEDGNRTRLLRPPSPGAACRGAVGGGLPGWPHLRPGLPRTRRSHPPGTRRKLPRLSQQSTACCKAFCRSGRPEKRWTPLGSARRSES